MRAKSHFLIGSVDTLPGNELLREQRPQPIALCARELQALRRLLDRRLSSRDFRGTHAVGVVVHGLAVLLSQPGSFTLRLRKLDLFSPRASREQVVAGAGAFDYVSKPVGLEQLRATFAKLK